MKFYDCATAPSPRRVRIFIAEKGLDIPVEQVDLGTGAQMSAAFRAKNPLCTVPVLELDDGSCLGESVAICDYLEALFPEPALFGRTPKEHALTLMWTHWVEDLGFAAVAEVFRNSAKGFKGRALPGPENLEQIPALVERGRQRIDFFYRFLDQALADRAYLIGEVYTFADISALVVVEFAQRVKLAMPESCTTLAEWYRRVAARPATRV
ncbi:MAG: glutathione S-transferase N-terminal domain-containing protein [Rhodocyclaceae bacterium]|nr:glutathione S-transferase N-terminal domain-containing protein [Rhodocyclaceae bacterium]